MTLGEDLREILTLGGLSFRTLVHRVFVEMQKDDVWGYSAQLAYYFLFSLFPFFIFLAALLAYVPVPHLMEQIMTLVRDFVPSEAANVIQENVEGLITRPRRGLLSLGIVLSLWSASSAIAAIGECLNRAYGVKEGRPFWKVRAMAMLLTIGLAVLIISSMALLMFGTQLGSLVADRFGIGVVFDWIWSLVRWPIVGFLMIFAAALVYYFTPDVEQEWRWITPGSVISVLAWIVMSLLFGYYVDNFGQYDKTYGSIGAVIVLLTWMYFSGFFLLLGGEINAEIEHAAHGGKNKGEKRLPASRRRSKTNRVRPYTGRV
ncbi:MAG: YihY/virulence factor BrkB family protein [Sulfurifustis sp.]